ncbi:Mor transcription activator family protein [Citrobacter braakii]|uniref:Mor transcription activator family protein n=1 Tax=Citrobacter braakii TaxID=57706 RepID=UPI003525EF62
MSKELKQVRELLPDIITELVDLIGWHNTVKMIERLGGCSFLVSKIDNRSDSKRASLLRKILPDNDVRIIQKQYGGETIYIPRCHSALRQLRNLSFMADYNRLIKSGQSQRFILMELCPKYGISDRWAQRIITESCDYHKQLPLL